MAELGQNCTSRMSEKKSGPGLASLDFAEFQAKAKVTPEQGLISSRSSNLCLFWDEGAN
jgi:hypothetical protein